jgi:hypothetical protein
MRTSKRLLTWIMVPVLAVISIPFWPRNVITPCIYVQQATITNRYETYIGHLAEMKMRPFRPLCTRVGSTNRYLL